jgi:hypothetical protein
MVLLEGIELSTSPLPRHSIHRKLAENRHSDLLGMPKIALCSLVYGATGPVNSGDILYRNDLARRHRPSKKMGPDRLQPQREFAAPTDPLRHWPPWKSPKP